MMKILCCGDRNWTNWDAIDRELRSVGPHAVIVHGAARGADSMCGKVANELCYGVFAIPAQCGASGIGSEKERKDD